MSESEISADAVTIAELAARKGENLGVSDWLTVDQDLINAFADVSGDHQWIHVDTFRAAAHAPSGTTIAHGFLLVALLSRFRAEAVPPFADAAMGINYGFDRLRFVSPVKAGDRVRGRFVLDACSWLDRKTAQLTWNATIELEMASKPALAATWLTRAITH
ncbi:MAG: MaoC family dehydratase [Pseudomonadota bacterium]